MVTREQVARAGYDGDPDIIAAASRDASPRIRASALIAAVRAGLCQPSDIDRGLTDVDATVRRTAIQLSRRVTPTRDIVALLDDPDSTVAEEAAFTLGELLSTPSGAVEALEHVAAGHADSLIREAAVASLGAIGAARSLPVIIAACGDIAAIRRRAAIALAAYSDDDAAVEQLRMLLDDRDRHVVQIAEDLLADPGDG